MKYRIRLAVLALAVVTAVSLSVPASGSSQSVAPAVDSYLYNDRHNPGVGVIHVWDGDYTYGQYDAVLPPDRRTDGTPLHWTQVEGFYIGAGYCGRLWIFNSISNNWREDPRVYWPGQHHLEQIVLGEPIARYWLHVYHAQYC